MQVFSGPTPPMPVGPYDLAFGRPAIMLPKVSMYLTPRAAASRAVNGIDYRTTKIMSFAYYIDSAQAEYNIGVSPFWYVSGHSTS